ncbi:MAG: hypothetical protein CVU29_09930 [Betaproteobacteria bacterium HGW-Betaproteobacteria-22]|nr:MAG: hypothetical protein CVU29_09930 [Betaproteobacteria bacterium HGW-Betaproteobacteria-22]
MADHQSHAHGADLNIVVPSDAFAQNAPYANHGNAYTVLAHGPQSQGELFVYSRADCADGGCAKVSPHDLAVMIKNDPHYQPGQEVALFSCNTGKWGDASFAQALSNELEAKVIAPNANIVGLSAIGTNQHAGLAFFGGWVVAEDIKQIDPEVTQPYGMQDLLKGRTVYSSPYNKVIVTPDGQKTYLQIEVEGKFEVFSPQKEQKKGFWSDLTSELNNNGVNALVQMAQFAATLPAHQQAVYRQRIAEHLNPHDLDSGVIDPSRQGTELE